MANKREISSTNPLQLNASKPVQLYIHFPIQYQVMEVTVVSTVKLAEIYLRIEQNLPYMSGVLVPSTSGPYFEYVMTVVPPSTIPANHAYVTMLPRQAANITALTIKACTGRVDSVSYFNLKMNVFLS